MRTLLQDIRYGLRVLWKSKGFTAVAVVTLALGIGANTAIFSVIDAALLRSLPYREPGRLVHLWETKRSRDFEQREASYPDFLDWRAQGAEVFEGLAGYTSRPFTLADAGEATRARGAAVTANFFDLLGVNAAAGRTFVAGEDGLETKRVAVISHGLWQRRFGGERSAVGREVTLDGEAYTVVGVLPAEFNFALLGDADVWTPLAPTPDVASRRYMHWLKVIGRLKQGVNLEGAQAHLATVASRIERDDPGAHAGVGLRAVPLQEEFVGPVRPVLFVLLGAVGFVLLIACTNVANLLLARSAARQKEIAIRAALGASRSRVVRQLLTESVLLSIAGGVLGLILSFWMTDALTTFFPNIAYTIVLDVSPDGRALLFTLAITLLTGIIFGLAPAFQATRPDLVPVLKGEAQRTGRARRISLRNALVVSQVALSLVVLVCAGLFVQSFRHAKSIDPGFATRDAFLVSVNPGLFGYEKEQGRDFYRRLAERVRATPGVEAAGFVDWMPLGDSASAWGPVYPAEQPAPAQGEGMGSQTEIVSAGYFKAMRIPLVEGRDFDERDRENLKPEAVVINETLARRLWPGETSVVGKRMLVGRDEPDAFEVVGVARNSKVRTLGEEPRNLLYVTVDQTYRGGLNLVVRAPGGGEGVVNAVRQAVKEIDGRMPLYNVRTIEQHLTWAFWAQNMAASLATAFGLLALALAAVGLYGVVAYTVARRTHEIGIRVALGAQARDILRIVLGQGMALTLVGLGAGLVGAFALARLLSSLLYGISPGDPATYILVALLLAVVALIACLVPARRAT
ncbi:MAG: hypothetical protein QOH49_4503, partial [Acidobacteriota bacterium]|nr:hypothetical protein [Acidobacteriota bacterium]